MRIAGADLTGRVVIVTKLRKVPKACSQCNFYDSMGGRGWGNDGVCTALGTHRSTRDIKVMRQRLDDCPLREVKRGSGARE